MIFHDRFKTAQVWQWVHRAQGAPLTICEQRLTVADGLDSMADSLQTLAIDAEEEESGQIDLTEITRRVGKALYARRERKPRARHSRSSIVHIVRLAEYDHAYFEDSLRWWLEYVYGIPRLGRQEELRLTCALRNGDQSAKKTLVEAHLYIVAEMAWKAAGSNHGLRVHLQDLIQAGNLGLIRAVEMFDPERGQRLQAFASLRIFNAMVRAQRNALRLIRLPAEVDLWLASWTEKWEVAGARLSQQLTREPEAAEIAEALGFDESDRKLSSVFELAVVPLDTSAYGRHARVVDTNRDHDPVQALAFADVNAELEAILDRLRPREKAVIAARFGFYDDRVQTLEEIGATLGVTRERVRQIEAVALKKIKAAGIQRKFFSPRLIELAAQNDVASDVTKRPSSDPAPMRNTGALSVTWR